MNNFSPSDFYTIVIFTMKAWLMNLYGKHSKFSKVTFVPCSLKSSKFSQFKKINGIIVDPNLHNQLLDYHFDFSFFLAITIDKECPHNILLALWMHSNWV